MKNYKIIIVLATAIILLVGCKSDCVDESELSSEEELSVLNLQETNEQLLDEIEQLKGVVTEVQQGVNGANEELESVKVNILDTEGTVDSLISDMEGVQDDILKNEAKMNVYMDPEVINELILDNLIEFNPSIIEVFCGDMFDGKNGSLDEFLGVEVEPYKVWEEVNFDLYDGYSYYLDLIFTNENSGNLQYAYRLLSETNDTQYQVVFYYDTNMVFRFFFSEQLELLVEE